MTDHALQSPAPDARRIVIDAEHFAVRFLVPVLGIGLAILFHVVTYALLRDTLREQGFSPGCMIVPGDILVFFVGAALTERLLKRLMPSRRYALLNDKSLTLVDERTTPAQTTAITWDKTLNVQAWRFQVSRRSRVPKGWYCLALYLLQDENDLILYTFMPEPEAEDLPVYEEFVRLRPRKETENSTDLHTVAQQRRLIKLEDRRWNDGGEISRDDFRVLVAWAARAVPDWG